MNGYEQRVKRTLDAVRMNKVDKVPFSYNGPAYLARAEGVPISKFVSNMKVSTNTSIQYCQKHPGIDSIHSPAYSPYTLPVMWLTEVKIPGIDLPDEELWQMHEKEQMTFEDYQAIIDKGYSKWLLDYLKKRVNNPITKALPFTFGMPKAVRKVKKAGWPVMNETSGWTPIEGFAGGRTLQEFFMDVMDEPEIVKQAMDVAWDYIFKLYKQNLKSKPFAAWIGGWRAAPEMMSHDVWAEFAWPYIKEMAEYTVAAGTIPVFHFDSCWDREIETLKELPARKCILMLDGFTDMRRAREILGDHMAIMGDVPATKLALGTADECYNYVTDMIRDCGETGIIISSGCDCPLNAKHENVEAMIQATLDWRV